MSFENPLTFARGQPFESPLPCGGGWGWVFKAIALKVATRNANRKNKVKNEAKRFDPSGQNL